VFNQVGLLPDHSRRGDKTDEGRIASKIEPMRIPLFHVNAFAQGPYSGNPAAVCLLDSWLDDAWLRKVAAENNLSATAFLMRGTDRYQLRWFTTRCEIRLCGHATLAAGLVVLDLLQPGQDKAQFETRHLGLLTVGRAGNFFAMDFPALIPQQCANQPPGLRAALGLETDPAELLEVNETYIVVLANQRMVASAVPDFSRIEKFHPHVVAITAPGEQEHFVSRYFAPSYGVPEDPVTGSVHCALTPYWSRRLGKTQLNARQLSDRGGQLQCELVDQRVILKGRAILTIQGTLTI
jgi:PhzF family phenazine biosynthesis protein